MVIEAANGIYVSGTCLLCRERGLIGNRSRLCPQCESGYVIVIPMCETCYNNYQNAAVCEVCGDVADYCDVDTDLNFIICPSCFVKGEMANHGLVYGECSDCKENTVLLSGEYVCEKCLLKEYMHGITDDRFTFCETCHKPLAQGDKCVYHAGKLLLNHE